MGNFWVSVCLSVRLYVSTVLNGSSPNLEGTFYGSWQIPWAIYVVGARNARACACSVHVLTACAFYIGEVWNQLSPEFHVSSLCTEQSCLLQAVERILSKFAGNVLLLTISVKDYVLFMFTHACARVCVHSLIFERIMSKLAGNILRLTISGKDYVLFIVTHCVYACKRASASACVITHSLYIYGRILFKFEHTTSHIK
jgi:hypothetical protein